MPGPAPPPPEEAALSDPRARKAAKKPAVSQVAAPAPGSLPLPALSRYSDRVLLLFVRAIPANCLGQCKLEDGGGFPVSGSKEEKHKFLLELVRQRLDLISRYEYEHWLNGQMPFVSFREIQIWRLFQFARFIWGWNLPEDEDIATIFNLTRRQGTNLVSDFHAKFRKLYIYPVLLRRLLEILSGEPAYREVRDEDTIGRVFLIPTRRYVEELNALISEFRQERRTVILRLAKLYKKNDQLMWVSENVVQLLNERRTEIEALYPIGVDAGG